MGRSRGRGSVAHDVFISYPTADKQTADAVVHALEAAGVRCWMAPRDIPPGTEFAAGIVEAIAASHLMVLVFSDAANDSNHILKEVREANDAGIPIIPFRTTESAPSPALKYYIGGTHWLDALTRPMERHLRALTSTVTGLLGGDRPSEVGSADPEQPPRIAATGISPPRSSAARPWWRRVPAAAWIAVGSAVIAGATVAAVLASGSGAPPTTPDPFADTRAGFVLANRTGINYECISVGWWRCEPLDRVDRTEAVAVGDFDGDGDTDVAFANTFPLPDEGYPGTSARNRVCLDMGTGWGCADLSEDEFESWSIASSDLNDDEIPDLIIGNTGPPQVCLGNGDGSFSCDWLIDSHVDWDTRDIAIGDFDLDGHPDAFLASGSVESSVCLGVGTGDVSCFPVFGVDHPIEAVAIGQFDGNGRPDLFSGSPPETGGDPVVCFNLTGTIDDPFEDCLSSPRHLVRSTATADLDGDGISEILIGGPGPESEICWVNQDPLGSLDCQMIDSGQPEASATLTTDLDRDGDLDVVFVGNSVNLCFNDGDGAIACQSRVGPAASEIAGAAVLP